MEHSRRKLSPFRQNRLEALRQYVGAHYSDDGAPDKVPVNLIELAANVYTVSLAARTPRVLATTPHREIKADAADLELALNFLLQEINFKRTLQRCVQDALFGFGIMKIGMEPDGTVDFGGGYFEDVGKPFAESVSLDNWLHDVNAECYEKATFAGDRYRLPMELLRESDLFDERVVSRLKPTTKMFVNEEGSEADERSESLSGGREGDPDEYMDFVDVWDIWLPLEGLIVTMPLEECDTDEKPLRIVEWNGPEVGPYRTLSFSDVPDNINPLPPVSTWMDLHDLANRLFRKLGRQAERQKTILGVPDDSKEDAERIIQANDGEAIRMRDPSKVKEYSFGGADQVGLAFTLQIRDLFSYMGGNLDALGGLGAMSDTVGQDELMSEQASKRIAFMQDRVYDFTKCATTDLGWHLYTDPLIELPLVKRHPMFPDVEIPVTWGPDRRGAEYYRYNIRIEPHSLQHQTPSSRLNTLFRVFGEMVAPFAPMMEAQGIQVNFEGLLRTVAKYSDFQELEDIISFSEPSSVYQPGAVGSPPEKAPMPANTTRRYVRESRATAGTRSGRDNIMARALVGSGVQQSEAASATRIPGM
jgi:hypothetical protein